VFFAGGVPHNIDGAPIRNLGGGPTQLALSEECADVVVQRSFSNLPKAAGKFSDFFEKIDSYVTIVSGPAIELHNANPFTYRITKKVLPDSIFKFQDTMTTKAEISDLSRKFRSDIVAIIGLGGTGAYILDFIAKTPVKEIRAFDPDVFHVHNAYRSPGRLNKSELGEKKADIYNARYDNFRTGLLFSTKFVDSTSEDDLEGVTFAFVCVDKGSSRAGIFDVLLKKKIPYIDVGMGLKRRENLLNGMLRVTHLSVENGKEIREKGLAELQDGSEDLYRANVQISELNALNASLAVIKFKQIRGFYFEEIPYYHLLFEIGDLKVVGDVESEKN
jgi:hypothetical protein